MELTAAQEDTLKAIHQLQIRGDGPVATSALASYCEKTAPTISSTLDTLADRGLVDREPYAGTELTPTGERVAIEVLRHHRLLETYLSEHLDYSWDTVHEEADQLEHHISERFETQIAAALDDPETDPHGDPIPNAELDLPAETNTVLLAQCDPDTIVTIQRVTLNDEADLAYLADRGIRPGCTARVIERAPFGMVTVSIDGTEQSIPAPIAEAIHVAPASSYDEPTAEAQEG